MTSEQMLIAAVGAMAAVIVYLFVLLQKRNDQYIQFSERVNNGFTDKLKKFMEFIEMLEKHAVAKRKENQEGDK